AGKHKEISNRFAAVKAAISKEASTQKQHSPSTIKFGLIVLTLLMFTKNTYVESFRSFYTFYLIDRFDVSISLSQIMLFVLLVAAAVGVLIGGIIGDKIGR